MRKTYVNSQDNFGVVTSTPDGQKISTMFRNIGKNAELMKMLEDHFNGFASQPPPGPVSDAAASLARSLGLRAFHVRITINGSTTPIDKCGTRLDPIVHEQIAHLLNAQAILVAASNAGG